MQIFFVHVPRRSFPNIDDTIQRQAVCWLNVFHHGWYCLNRVVFTNNESESYFREISQVFHDLADYRARFLKDIPKSTNGFQGTRAHDVNVHHE